MKTAGSRIFFAFAFLILTCISCVTGSSFPPDETGPFNRKLMATTPTFSTATTKDVSDSFNLEDYPGHDPSPNTKVDVHAGPIANGTPLMSYAPMPSPQTHPNRGHGHGNEHVHGHGHGHGHGRVPP